jgi:class 3 adenylate cyclase
VIAQGGRVVEVRADETFSVFENVGQAVTAAVTVQRELAEKSWVSDAGIRVRAGIHTGGVSLEDGGYIGLAVHTAARICAAAHGGQVVVSGDTKAALGASVPSGLHLHHLGRHRLAGLPDLVGLYQVEGEGLMTEFPRLRNTGSRR